MNSAEPSIPTMVADIVARRLRLMIVRYHMRRHRRHLIAADHHEEIAERHLDRAAALATKFRV